MRQLDDGRYTVITERDRLREEPPDVLLTNHKMLDFLLIRARDSVLWRHNAPIRSASSRGRAAHVRRRSGHRPCFALSAGSKARLRTPRGACVRGTSATLGSEGQERLLAFAGDVFPASLSMTMP